MVIIMSDSVEWEMTLQMAGEHHRLSNAFKIRSRRDGASVGRGRSGPRRATPSRGRK